jgi:tetratricopeptide (TPR) repeat protein
MQRSIQSLRFLLVCCFTMSVLNSFASRDAFGQGGDTVAGSLGLTADKGSLPLWAKPDLQAQQDLANFTRNAQQSVMIVGHPKRGYGTAWVFSKKHRLLATNAHVADIMKPEGTMMAIINGTTQVYKVERAWYHPGVSRYLRGDKALVVRSMDPNEGPVAPNSPDLAVLQLSEEGPDLPSEFQIATTEELESIFAQPVALIGFPSHDTNAWPQLGETAVATYHAGVISRLTDFNLNPNVIDGDKQFVQYTMSTWSGFSGSPVFLPNGHVVAAHNMARYVSNDAGFTQALPHGIRIDCLWELLVHHGLDNKVSLGMDKSQVRVQRWLDPDPKEETLRQVVTLTDEASGLVFREKKYTDAVNKCNEAIKLAPYYARPYQIRCDAYTHYWVDNRRQIDFDTGMQQLRYAEADARKYISLAPSDPRGITGLCFVLNDLGQYTRDYSYNRRALNVLNKLVTSENLSNRRMASALSCRAIALDNLDAKQDALDDHNEAVRLAPDEPVFLENRADFWHYQGRGDLEEADYAKARELRKKQRGG